MENKNIYCAAPFVNLSTTNNGKIRLCCQSEVIDKLHVNKHSLDRIWQGPEYWNIRNKFLNNEWPEHCKKCKVNEEKGIPSRRAFENSRWKDIAKEDFPQKALDFPWSIDLRFGNLCNLKCIMCTPDNSNKWYDEYEHFKHLQFFDKDENVRWSFHPSFLDSYKEWIDKVKVLYFSGGEPLLLKKHREILTYLVKNDLAKNIVLWYDTNATYVDQEWLDIWSNFEEVNLSCSIDGGKKVNEYIRHPINHDALLENYELLATRPANVKVRLQISVSALNIYEIDTIREYSKRYNFIIGFNVSIVYWPNFMTLEALPQTIIDDVTKKYESLPPTHRVRGMTRNLKHDPQKLIELKEYLTKIDELRNLNHKECFPYLYTE